MSTSKHEHNINFPKQTGVSSCSIDASVTEPEKDSILSVNFINGNNSNRFRYDKSSSTISFNVDYDIDQATGYPENVVLQLEAKDRYGATSTAPVYIKVHDINDNTCDFGASSTKVFTANQGMKFGSLGNIYAVDNDKTAPNNEVTYEVIQALPSDSTNYISAYSDGSIDYIGGFKSHAILSKGCNQNYFNILSSCPACLSC
ncbi:cadherin-23 [Biomphalaria pfeifferi]|uniref:Cadherin-23 n=1 Tax=Biomphalaria pfeifferi TaxID=112525 RepID=A0AAD8FJ20_BIOPF|nr:cadherin-23 [Biomphalaria pfeifferi]